jgi:hypothetical protein
MSWSICVCFGLELYRNLKLEIMGSIRKRGWFYKKVIILWFPLTDGIVACRLVAREWPRNKRDKQWLLSSSQRQWTGWVAITWEPQQTRTKQWQSNRGTVFSTWSVPRCYNRDDLEQRTQCSVEIHAVKRRLYVCCSYSDIWSVYFGETVIVTLLNWWRHSRLNRHRVYCSDS